MLEKVVPENPRYTNLNKETSEPEKKQEKKTVDDGVYLIYREM